MAFPADFPESNNVLGAPGDMGIEECEPLSVAHAFQDNHPLVISCWKLTREELDEVNRTGRVWLGIFGQTMPPAWVSGQRPFA